jgi:hypothetical protein
VLLLGRRRVVVELALFLVQMVSLGVWPVSACAPSTTILIPRLYLSKKFSTSAGTVASCDVGCAP